MTAWERGRGQGQPEDHAALRGAGAAIADAERSHGRRSGVRGRRLRPGRVAHHIDAHHTLASAASVPRDAQECAPTAAYHTTHPSGQQERHRDKWLLDTSALRLHTASTDTPAG